MQCNAMQCDAMRCNAMQFNAMQSDAMLYCATQLDPFNLNYSIQSECPLSYIHSASARATVEEVLVRKSRLNANRAWISAKRTPLEHQKFCGNAAKIGFPTPLECNAMQCNARECNATPCMRCETTRAGAAHASQPDTVLFCFSTRCNMQCN